MLMKISYNDANEENDYSMECGSHQYDVPRVGEYIRLYENRSRFEKAVRVDSVLYDYEKNTIEVKCR